ncbi:FAD-dependent oxidoreductase [Streptomyces sp. NPDC001941]|uniref:FAD-dependent oxidoreductase n=1 Tax=Streptomyces sp. NPDC001941 TaxID=3154659 RepID=UPI003330C7CC
MSDNDRGRNEAVIIGAGYAGLLAARVLADHFNRVTLIERDEITEETTYRSGIPQARHPHVMLAKGSQILEDLFPGLTAELHARGAPVFDFGSGFRMLLPSGWAPRTELGIQVQSFTRVLLERTIRSRVMAIPNVRLLDRRHVTGLTGGRQITGVLTQIRNGQTASDSLERLRADLVIDASGRSTRLPQWLTELGYPLPKTRTVDGNLTYASRLYRIPPGSTADWRVSAQTTFAPTIRSGATVVAVEDRQWLTTLLGAAGRRPPTEDAEITTYAAMLANPDLSKILTEADPASATYRYTKLGNRWHRYGRRGHWPERLLAVGDSTCTFNPMYGQGMTIAALEAVLLRDLLRTRCDLNGLGRRFHRRVNKMLLIPWASVTSNDLGWQPGRPPPLARIIRWYFSTLLACLPADPALYRRFARVQHMLDHPRRLVAPAVLLHVLVQAIRQARTTPTALTHDTSEET